MAPILHDDILIGSQKVPLFKIRIIDGFDDPSYLDSSVDLPMYTLAIEQVEFELMNLKYQALNASFFS